MSWTSANSRFGAIPVNARIPAGVSPTATPCRQATSPAGVAALRGPVRTAGRPVQSMIRVAALSGGIRPAEVPSPQPRAAVVRPMAYGVTAAILSAATPTTNRM